ncbi:site-specific integrase [Flavobacterium sp. TR2]|uniref:site-specific integrase n=1 Tax=Flavobacterium sp. TR2 TaxID=2977321 RepID=UPI0021B0BF7E|nr:site-specific integrase [Flavobacterium sp. TR2]UWY27868.1 site-specific integrase [Flavobacterium sp. TR2]
MANLKVLLDKRRQKNDGNYNVIFRITHNRKVYTLNSGISTTEMYWNEQRKELDKSHPNSKLLNIKLSKEYFKIQQLILELDETFSITDLKNKLEGKANVSEAVTFKSFSDKLIVQMFEVKKTGNALVYQTAVNQFVSFASESSLLFSDIDYTLLERFVHHLQIKGLKQNSISNYLRTIRAIYNKAIKAKIVERSFYPFNDLIIKSEKTGNRAVLRKDILKFEQMALVENSGSWKAVNCFLLSFYLVGMSFTDLAYLKTENIINGRIIFKRRKTHKNYSIKLFAKSESIINKFNSATSKYLIPVLNENIPEDSQEAKKIIKQWIKTTNKYLKRLGRQEDMSVQITTYVARHTFATTAKRLGYSNEIIAEALGHEYGNRTTNIYLHSFNQNIVDEMHFSVIC